MKKLLKAVKKDMADFFFLRVKVPAFPFFVMIGVCASVFDQLNNFQIASLWCVTVLLFLEKK